MTSFRKKIVNKEKSKKKDLNKTKKNLKSKKYLKRKSKKMKAGGDSSPEMLMRKKIFDIYEGAKKLWREREEYYESSGLYYDSINKKDKNIYSFTVNYTRKKYAPSIKRGSMSIYFHYRETIDGSGFKKTVNVVDIKKLEYQPPQELLRESLIITDGKDKIHKVGSTEASDETKINNISELVYLLLKIGDGFQELEPWQGITHQIDLINKDLNFLRDP